jgi:hypothetical protein
LDVQRWAVLRLLPKKVPPPAPDGREGRLFPPEQSWKTAELVIELAIGGNKILQEVMQRAEQICNKHETASNSKLNSVTEAPAAASPCCTICI